MKKHRYELSQDIFDSPFVICSCGERDLEWNIKKCNNCGETLCNHCCNEYEFENNICSECNVNNNKNMNKQWDL